MRKITQRIKISPNVQNKEKNQKYFRLLNRTRNNLSHQSKHIERYLYFELLLESKKIESILL